MLLGDKELREFSGTLQTASSVSDAPIDHPPAVGHVDRGNPAAAATIFEAQVLPERGFQGEISQPPPPVPLATNRSVAVSSEPEEEEEGSPWLAAFSALAIALALLGVFAAMQGSSEASEEPCMAAKTPSKARAIASAENAANHGDPSSSSSGSEDTATLRFVARGTGGGGCEISP